jgi:hypothetical protein
MPQKQTLSSRPLSTASKEVLKAIKHSALDI